MEHTEEFASLSLVDDLTVKDVFAEFCIGLNFVHGNLAHNFCLGHGRSQCTASGIKTDHLSPNCYADNPGP